MGDLVKENKKGKEERGSKKHEGLHFGSYKYGFMKENCSNKSHEKQRFV
jgi:hypothetical protein